VCYSPEVYEQSGFDKLQIINLPLKELQHERFRCLFKEPEINGLNRREAELYLRASYPNGKKFETHLVTYYEIKSRIN